MTNVNDVNDVNDVSNIDDIDTKNNNDLPPRSEDLSDKVPLFEVPSIAFTAADIPNSAFVDGIVDTDPSPENPINFIPFASKDGTPVVVTSEEQLAALVNQDILDFTERAPSIFAMLKKYVDNQEAMDKKDKKDDDKDDDSNDSNSKD